MKIAAIIAEYGPFHNGHAYHIARTRQNCDAVVCVMDGHISQRGQFMPLSRFSRARAALMNGADIVVELPSLFACRTADKFADAGVRIAASLGADALSFGSENADMDALRRAAFTDEDDTAREAIATALSQGKTLPRARYEAGLTFAEPNSILAVEYLRALARLGENAPEPMAITRIGDYSSHELGEMASAAAIRAAVRRGDMVSAAPAVPQNALWQLDEMLGMRDIDDAVLAALRSLGAEGIARLPDMNEGLENRIYAAAQRAATVEEMLDDAKCKRYTRARLSRAAAHAVTGLTAELAYRCPTPQYIRIIGMRRDAGQIMREIKMRATLPIMSAADLKGDACFDFECRVTDLWALTRTNPIERRGGLEFTQKFVIID